MRLTRSVIACTDAVNGYGAGLSANALVCRRLKSSSSLTKLVRRCVSSMITCMFSGVASPGMSRIIST